MKHLAYFSAFLLILMISACEQRFSRSVSPSRSHDKAVVVESPQAITLAEREDELHFDKVKRKGLVQDFNTEDYDHIVENVFQSTAVSPLSTFSIDVDAASYTNVRRYLNSGKMPPAGSVRVEEMINFFRYAYPEPVGDEHPVAMYTEAAPCPWNQKHVLVHVGMKGKQLPLNNLPASNLVFLVDVSGSMQDYNKLPLVKKSLAMLTSQLRPDDRVSIVVYAGAAGLVLEPTSGQKKDVILEALNRLEAGGSTAGGEGIELAYATARKNFIDGGNNRIVLATDGDFNVGGSSDADMVELVTRNRNSGVYLSVLGFGMGNYKDNKMQKLADNGNGNHYYVDDISEAKRIFMQEFGSTLYTIANDVKLQVEFNPAQVSAYRLIGYENRLLQDRDFNDDQKDAGELGSGHTVTALYEIIPAGVEDSFVVAIDPLRYQQPKSMATMLTDELMNIKIRYKKPGSTVSQLLVHPVKLSTLSTAQTSDNFRFSAAVAAFGMMLRNSAFKQQSSYEMVLQLAQSASANDDSGFRNEFCRLVSSIDKIAHR